ncbi:unnamed protein product, partial [Hapterophycus canaliculatus]
EFDIFDDETSKKIQAEYERDIEDAAKAIGARRLGLITGDAEKTSTETWSSSAGRGLMKKLSSASSLFSRKTTRAPPPPATAASTATPTPTPTAPCVSPTVHPPSDSLPVPPAAIEVKSTPTDPSPEAPSLAREQEKAAEEPASVSAVARKEPSPVPASPAPVDADASEKSTASPPAPPAALPVVATAAPEQIAAPAPAAPAIPAAETVLPELKVVTFDVREPSLGASVVGHVAVLDGSCYVWAGTEGSSAQGSLAAAVGTRFDGGMPTATPLLAGEGGAGGEAGGAAAAAAATGGVSVSMAQRLCRRTGRMVFVSCDLSEDSQILVAAVEAKVVALLKAEA